VECGDEGIPMAIGAIPFRSLLALSKAPLTIKKSKHIISKLFIRILPFPDLIKYGNMES